MPDASLFRRAFLLTRLLLACLFAAATLVAAPAAAQEAANRRVAFVVGNGGYLAAGKMNTRLVDARAIADTLRNDLGFAVRLVSDATRAEFLAELDAFARSAEGAELAMVYYIGYAAVTGGENYLLPIDARLPHERDLPGQGIALSHLLARIAPARARVVTIDACTANPVTQGMMRGDPQEPPPQGMAHIPNPPPGTLITLSTTPGTSAATDCNDTRHPFTSALLRYLPSIDDDVRTVIGKVVDAASAATRSRAPQQKPSVADTLPDKSPVLRPTNRTATPQGADRAPPATRPPASPPASPPPAAPGLRATLPAPGLSAVPPVPVLPAVPLPVPVPVPTVGASQDTSGGTQAPPRLVAPITDAPPPAAPAQPQQAAPPQPSPPPRAARPRTPGGYACPEPGTTTTTLVGRERTVTIYEGTDPSDPALCLARTDDGRAIRRYYNFFDAPMRDTRFLRGFDNLLAGREDTLYQTRWLTTIEPILSQSSRISGDFREQWDRLPSETIAIDGRSRSAIVLERTLNGVHNRVHTEIRYWLDSETGLWLKADPTRHSQLQTRMIVTQFGRR